MQRRCIPLTALLALLLGVSLLVTQAHAASVLITPAGAFNDNNGTSIQAHGGGMIKIGSTYYWFGEDKAGENASNTSFQHVPCYSSTDLAHWTFVNYVLTRQGSGDLGPNRIVERPKVIYNSTTRQYVMYMHIDTSSYSENNVGVATSSSICGNYTYLGSSRPLGNRSRDITLYQDDDGTAYLLSEDPTNGLRIDKLSADYLSVASAVAVLNPDHEAPAMFKLNGRYYLFGSFLTGWGTNDNQYTTATSLAGPWSSWSYFAPVGSNTYNSQTTFILPVVGSSGTTFMYMGDRWTTSNLGASPYIWLPLQVNGSSVTLPWYTTWSIDTVTGLWGNAGSTYAINAGRAAAGPFSADKLYSGGNTYSTTATINTSSVSNPAPQAVYQTERYGNFSYTLPGLTPGSPYTVRLHFAEVYWTSSGQRLFNVAINGQQILSNFDIYATAGAVNKAIVEQYTATANSDGQITIQFISVKDSAKVSGIEVLANTGATATPTPTRAPMPTPTVTSTPTPNPTPTSGQTCSVQYAITNQWVGGFGASVMITNTGTSAINGWILTWSFANGQTITQLWNGNATQSGSTVSVTNVSYNGTITPGGNTNFGFNGSWNGGSNSSPTVFRLNGAACTIA